MGCWNETCALTGLPIHCGDLVWAVPITQKHPGDSVHCDGAFAPMFPPVKATYDDYGNVEDIVMPADVIAAYNGFDFYRVDEPGHETKIALPDIESKPKAFIRTLIDMANSEVVEYERKENGRRGRLWVVFVRDRFYDMAQNHVEDGIAKEIAECEFRFRSNYRHWPAADRIAMAKLWAFMNRNRLSWHPTTGSGSQSDVDTEVMAFHHAVYEEAQRLYEADANQE